MKDLKNMILESSNNELKKKVELVLTCNIEHINDVESDNAITDYDNPEDFLWEETRFYIDFDIEFELLNGKEQLGYLKCYLNTTFDVKNSDVKLNKNQTQIEFDGDKMIGFTANDISTLILNAMDKDKEIWQMLHDAFGYNVSDTKAAHEMFTYPAFQKDLKKEIEEYYLSFTDKSY